MDTAERTIPDIDELVHCYYGAVVRLALAILDNGSPEADPQAEDAAQETFIAAAGALREYRGTASLKTWLFAIAINTCRSRLRKRRARQALTRAVTTFQRIFGGIESPEQRAECAERDRQLWTTVNALDEKHRLVVVLRYVHELPAAEIAQALGITEGTVHSRLHYARQQLAGQLRRSTVLEEAL